MPSAPMPILYSFRRCPYAIRARLALQVAQISCELREVVLRDKPPSLLEASPKGTVPVLILGDGRILDESLEIMDWALSQRDPQHWHSGSPEEGAKLIARNDEEFKFNLDRYKYAGRHEGAGDPEAHRAAASAILVDLDTRLRQSPWLCGDRLSKADTAIAPFVRQFANTDRPWFDSQPWPALLAWLEDFLRSPLFVSVMTKYPAWKERDAPMLFPQVGDDLWARHAR